MYRVVVALISVVGICLPVYADRPNCVRTKMALYERERLNICTTVARKADDQIEASEYLSAATAVERSASSLQDCVKTFRRDYFPPATQDDKQSYYELITARAELVRTVKGLSRAAKHKNDEIRNEYIRLRLELGLDDPAYPVPVWDEWRSFCIRYQTK